MHTLSTTFFKKFQKSSIFFNYWLLSGTDMPAKPLVYWLSAHLHCNQKVKTYQSTILRYFSRSLIRNHSNIIRKAPTNSAIYYLIVGLQPQNAYLSNISAMQSWYLPLTQLMNMLYLIRQAHVWWPFQMMPCHCSL